MKEKDFKKAYRQIMDQQGPSEQVMQAAIMKMKQRQAELEVEKKRVWSGRRIGSWVAVAACAAALCVFFLGTNQQKLVLNPFTAQDDARLSMVYRADAKEQLALQETMEKYDKATNIDAPDIRRTAFQFNEFALDENAPYLWVALATYQAKAEIELSIASFRTASASALLAAEASTVDGHSVYAGVDEQTGAFYAVWEWDNCYYTMKITQPSALTESDRITLIKTMHQIA